VQHECDEYFNAPDRNFKDTDEAFRIRTSGDAVWLTYKGPKLPGEVKTREELELSLQVEVEQLRQLLLALRFRPVATVAKQRELFELTRDGFSLSICLDTVQQVGEFVEIEALAEPSQAEAASRVVQELARELGLTDVVRRSYLGLVLEAQGRESSGSPTLAAVRVNS
jgi:adenylate cyclase class 2